MPNQVVQKKTLTKEEFSEQLNEVKEKLPKGYGQILQFLYPGIDMNLVYNVVHGKVRNEEILEKLKKISLNKN